MFLVHLSGELCTKAEETTAMQAPCRKALLSRYQPCLSRPGELDNPICGWVLDVSHYVVDSVLNPKPSAISTMQPNHASVSLPSEESSERNQDFNLLEPHLF